MCRIFYHHSKQLALTQKVSSLMQWLITETLHLVNQGTLRLTSLDHLMTLHWSGRVCYLPDRLCKAKEKGM